MRNESLKSGIFSSYAIVLPVGINKSRLCTITCGHDILFAEVFSARWTRNGMSITQIAHWPEIGLHGGGRILRRHIAIVIRKAPNALATMNRICFTQITGTGCSAILHRMRPHKYTETPWNMDTNQNRSPMLDTNINDLLFYNENAFISDVDRIGYNIHAKHDVTSCMMEAQMALNSVALRSQIGSLNRSMANGCMREQRSKIG